MRTSRLLPVLLLLAGPTSAEALKTAAVGCTALADAQRLAGLQATDRAGASAFSRPLVASRACLDFAKGLRIDIDERRPPLVCIRLPGDLSCYWVATAVIDDHPSEKGAAGGDGHRGAKRH